MEKRSALRGLILTGISLLSLAPAAVPAQAMLPAGLIEREVSVIGGPVALPGTLTLPAGKGPFRAVVLIHGSGPGDRDETVLGNKPFRDIAWGLAQHGVMVLRYDKRAKVQPMWYANRAFTVYDEVTQDALNALMLLRAQPETDRAHTFLLGHSLGGMLAPKLALTDGHLAGIIIMAGATQVTVSDQAIRQYEWMITLAGKDSMLARQQLGPTLAALAKVRALTAADSADLRPLAGMGGTTPKYWVDLNAYNPGATMRQVKLPALVLQGMRDYQVLPEQLDGWLKAVGPRTDLTVRRYPGLTHLFTRGDGPPSPAEYNIPKTVEPQVITDIVSWISAQPRARVP